MQNSVQAVAVRTGLLCGAAGGVFQDIGALWQTGQPFVFLYVVAFCVEWTMYLLALSMRLTLFRVDTANCVFLILAPPLVFLAYVLPFRLQGYRSIFVGFDLLACYTVLRGCEVLGLGLVRDCQRAKGEREAKEIKGAEGAGEIKEVKAARRAQTAQRAQKPPFSAADPATDEPALHSHNRDSPALRAGSAGADPLPLFRKGAIRAFRASNGIFIATRAGPQDGERPFLVPGKPGLEPEAPERSAIQPADYLMCTGLVLKLASDQCFISHSFYPWGVQASYTLPVMRCVLEGLGSLLLAYASLAAML